MNPLLPLYISFRGCEPQSIDLLPAAGSNRKYYRLTGSDGEPALVGVVGTSVEENRAFCTLTRLFSEAGLNVPELYAVSDDGLCYLQQDLGSTSLFDAIRKGRESGGNYSADEQQLLVRTISLLPRFQFEAAMPAVFAGCYPMREMDSQSVMFDLNYFKYDFLKLTGIEFNEVALQQDFCRLTDDLLAENEEQTFMYRDFQARNVMLTADGTPCFIDYQGGRRGPIYYDVASFLWQASAHYSDELRSRLIDAYLLALQPYRSMTCAEFDGRLHLFVLFRLLQVLGAYGFRGLWEKKRHFVDSIPPAVGNLEQELQRGTCAAYPHLQAVCQAIIEWNRQRQAEPRRGGIRVYSFSYKRGIPADATGNGGGYVFDCRGSNNPGRYDEYKPLTGLDKPVIDYLERDGEIVTFLERIYPLADFHVQRWIDRGFSDLMFCFGCTGGRHRSVYSAQHLAEHIHQKFGVPVYLCHREQNIEQFF